MKQPNWTMCQWSLAAHYYWYDGLCYYKAIISKQLEHSLKSWTFPKGLNWLKILNFLKEMKTDEAWMQVKDKIKFSKELTTKYLSKTESQGFSSKNSKHFCHLQT